jgi:hypothetical protein
LPNPLAQKRAKTSSSSNIFLGGCQNASKVAIEPSASSEAPVMNHLHFFCSRISVSVIGWQRMDVSWRVVCAIADATFGNERPGHERCLLRDLTGGVTLVAWILLVFSPCFHRQLKWLCKMLLGWGVFLWDILMIP